MSEKEEDLKVEEKADGTVTIGLGEDVTLPEHDIVNHDEQQVAAKDDKEDDDTDEKAEGGQVDDEETDEDREKIREQRREERRLKKELQKQREASAKHKISSLERQNQELARRLASLESTATSLQMTQIDKAIDDEATRVEYTRLKLLEASRAGDHESQIEMMEQFADAKKRLEQIQALKNAQIEQVKRPKQNVPTPISKDIQVNATNWMKKNSWYDPAARDTDSRIAKVVDSEMAHDGWDPADPDYWDELDNRLQERLPHRYTRPGQGNRRQGAGPSAGTKTQVAPPKGKSIELSRERVQAIKDAGAWDDPAKRTRMIKAYLAYDKANSK